MVRSGVVDLALAGGSEAPLSMGFLKSWEALRVVSPDTCRPFSRDRRGLILGEGAAMFVIPFAALLVYLAGLRKTSGVSITDHPVLVIERVVKLPRGLIKFTNSPNYSLVFFCFCSRSDP